LDYKIARSCGNIVWGLIIATCICSPGIIGLQLGGEGWLQFFPILGVTFSILLGSIYIYKKVKK
jgi:CHASE2 domain-containing sensor protein